MFRFFNATLATVLIVFLSASCVADIYVSPSGDDAAQGTQQHPVATVGRALELSIKQDAQTIVFDDGTYFLSNPVIMTAEYSGTANAPKTFKAINEGAVVFSAGQPVEVDWKPFRNGIYSANLPKNLDLETGCDGLFVNGQFQRMARYPNYDPNARWLKGSSSRAFSPQRIKSWNNPAGGFLHAMHPAHWGGNHWEITGKKSDSECVLEGGWMNNRGGGIHPTDRFVENIFEELDDSREWFLDREQRVIYWKPVDEESRKRSRIVLSRNESCIRISGTAKKPVKHMVFDGISFRHTSRTFMKTKEPLLRSDWRIYRGGAVFLEGAENIEIKNCEFTNLGGNAFFASGFNRNLQIRGCHFHNIGAGAIQFVGNTSAVHNPMFQPYGRPVDWNQINKFDRGPKTNNFPTDCLAEDCLIHDIGLIEKQVAGLQISVAANITGRHLSIYDVPRAGINIGENAFGGHVIEFCDVFDTVQESSDHGSFNSWGRDRYWHTNYELVNKQVEENPELPKIDMLKPNTIRNSRWKCDHGWDIDLDDGSAWYIVENNLCLGGGIKLREGYYRTVRNNLIVGDTFHPHVWFEKSGDVIESNIVAKPYKPIRLGGKGKSWNRNIHLSKRGLYEAQGFAVDPDGINVDFDFSDPRSLDFGFVTNSSVRETGFQQFDLKKFGVQNPRLAKIARKPTFEPIRETVEVQHRTCDLFGATFKRVTTNGEVSATGLPDMQGVLFLDVPKTSAAFKAGFRPNDVVRSVDRHLVNTPTEFIHYWAHANSKSKSVNATLWRTQQKSQVELSKFPGVVLTASAARIDGTAFFDKTKNYIGRWTDVKTSLHWNTRLQPNREYQILVTQASVKGGSKWKLTGLTEVMTIDSTPTGGWEDFETVVLESGTTFSQVEDSTSIGIEPIDVIDAVMNFRDLILIFVDGN